MQFIENGKLKFSPPIEFDDPFELRPQPGDPTLSIEDSNIFLGDDLRMRDWYNSTKSTTPFDEWLGPRRASPPEFNLEVARVLREVIENYCPGALASISKEYGMACFSETASDVRMWSHYADEHKGIVVGLDRNSLGINLLPVRCKSERVHFTASQFTNPQPSWVVELLTTKSEDWRYQKEWRAVLRLGEPPLKYDDQLGAHVYEVPREAIKRVLSKQTMLRRPYADQFQTGNIAEPIPRILKLRIHRSAVGEQRNAPTAQSIWILKQAFQASHSCHIHPTKSIEQELGAAFCELRQVFFCELPNLIDGLLFLDRFQDFGGTQQLNQLLVFPIIGMDFAQDRCERQPKSDRFKLTAIRDQEPNALAWFVLKLTRRWCELLRHASDSWQV